MHLDAWKISVLAAEFYRLFNPIGGHMKNIFVRFALVGLLFGLAIVNVSSQITTGSISGTVSDSTGAVVPGASVSIKGQSGQRYSATTNEEGVYTVPGVTAGTPTYTVSVSATNFKTSIVQNVKVDVATPATVNVVLQAGKIEETVVITSGGEVLQAETATVGTTITGRQILETPIQSRDALDLITLLPGTSTTGVVRTSSINGLPKSALTIQIDGVDVQDNFLKSSDGFFTFIRPRIDAIDEVTVSTASPGAESSGDGAVGIRFATRRGTDDYKGSLFYQHRDEGLNTANFQNNYLKQAKNKLRLNQFGGSFGGPIPFVNFGEGVGAYDSGRGSRYFFVNYERFHLNEASPVRTRQVLTAEAQGGVFRYGTTGGSTANLLAIANAAGLTNTLDPTVASVLNTIRESTATKGSFQPFAGGIFFRQPFTFSNDGMQRRRFLVARTDFNITKNHALEVVYNDQPFRSNVDFLNNVDPSFPGVTNAGTQLSDRRSLSVGFRSSFGQSIVNQFRYAQLGGWLGGASNFDLVGGEEFFDNTQRGFNLALGSGLTNLTIRNAYTSRASPTRDFTDNVTWVTRNHTVTFGGQLKNIQTISDAVGPVRSTVTFGDLGSILDPTLTQVFNATTLPGASNAELANARAVYSTIVGRVSAFASTAFLGADGRYALNGPRHFEIEEDTNGVFLQDQWRLRNNLSLSYGVRWQPQTGARLNTANYSTLTSSSAMAFDVSGFGNSFSPGTLTGQAPTLTGNQIGDRAFKNDMNNLAPSVGVVYSPDFKSGIGNFLFGGNGTSVIRGGFSRAFIREGTLTVENSIGQNPGGALGNGRSAAVGTAPAQILTVGTLFRAPGNPNLIAPAFNPVPAYPRAVNPVTDATFAFAQDFHSGYVDSWSAGYQRQFGRDTVVEVRYVGNRGKDMQTQYRVNEVNAIENGLGAEFALAQRNLLTNIAAGQGATFAFTGIAGTSPLPITLSYFSGNSVNPALAGSYSSALFSNATFLNQLNPASPGPQAFANTLDTNFRANTTTAGSFQGAKPLNFVNTCPSTNGFCYLFDNSEKSWYDSAVIEVRRRLSAGLRFQASYVYAKSFTNAYASAGDAFFGVGGGDQSNVSSNTLRNRGRDKSYSQIDTRHAFKFDATYDLPFGKGRKFLASSNGFVDAVLGGWTITPVVRWQSGAPILMENIQTVGMTGKELQDSVGVYYNQVINGTTVPVSYLPADIITQTIRAFTLVTPTTVATSSGYAAGTAPSGRFIAPAGYNNCQQRSAGECGFRKFVLYGPNFFKLDSSVGKRFKIGEHRSVELRATMFDVLNRTNWRLGGWTGNVNNITVFTGTFGQMLGGWAYQDPNGSNDPGGRITDLMLRINF
jgi:hypothetical protein